MNEQKAIFAGGCFWGIEDRFLAMDEVIETRSGYTGGETADPTYEQVCTGRTGHAEAVEVLFDADKVCYSELVVRFFAMHDPTTLNRQGPDVGTQYRSAIYYLSEEQRTEAQKILSQTQKDNPLKSPIVTEVTAATAFYPAETYHQKYFHKRRQLS